MLETCKNCGGTGLLYGPITKGCPVCKGKGMVEVEVINGEKMIGLDEKDFEAKIDLRSEGGLITDIELHPVPKPWYKFW